MNRPSEFLVSVRAAETPADFESAISVRRNVFQEEQGVERSLDEDEYDADARHYLAYIGDRVVGAARVRLIESGEIGKVERVAVLKECRRYGVGAAIMSEIERYLKGVGCKSVKLNAQEYIADFYSSLGYEPVGEVFQDAGIPHISMVKRLI